MTPTFIRVLALHIATTEPVRRLIPSRRRVARCVVDVLAGLFVSAIVFAGAMWWGFQ